MIKLTVSNQGNRNASDGIALAQTIESGMDEMSGMLQKIRTLAVQASNGTNSSEDRAALAKEATALVNEMSRIAKQTTYGGKTVLAGGTSTSIYSKAKNASLGGKMTLQVGSNKGDTITFDVASFQFSHIAKGSSKGFKDIKGSAANAILFSTAAAAQELIASVDSLIAKVDSQRAGLGAIQNHFPVISSPHKTSSKPDILAVLNSFERMATFRWFFLCLKYSNPSPYNGTYYPVWRS